MTPGLKLGDRVQADAVAVLGGQRTSDVCGPWARKRVLYGLVVEVVGTGRQRKFKIKWDECDDESVLSPQVLEREAVAVGVTERADSTVESDSNNADREELRGPEEDLTEVDPLKLHGTSWNVQNEIDINFDQGWHPNLQIAWVARTPERTQFHYFKIMFPMDDANDWIMKTNSSSKLNRISMAKSEYFRF